MPNTKFHFRREVIGVEFDPGPQFAFRVAATIAALSQLPTEEDIAAMAALLRDMKAIHSGDGPTAQELETAPQLTDWRYLIAPDGLRLTGRVAGHPLLGERNLISTSPLYAIDSRERLWARTLRRYYRLGSPRADRVADKPGNRHH